MSAAPFAQRLSLLTPEQGEAMLKLMREQEAADEESLRANSFARGQHAALALLRPRQARAIACIDPVYIDDWNPVPTYGWGLDLYAAAYRVRDPGDIYRDDVESFVEKLLGTPYPDAIEVCAFIEGVADMVDRL